MSNFLLGVLVGAAGVLAAKISVEYVQRVDINAGVPAAFDMDSSTFDEFWDFFSDGPGSFWEGDPDGSE
jgi:hypothetical protein